MTRPLIAAARTARSRASQSPGPNATGTRLLVPSAEKVRRLGATSLLRAAADGTAMANAATVATETHTGIATTTTKTRARRLATPTLTSYSKMNPQIWTHLSLRGSSVTGNKNATVI